MENRKKLNISDYGLSGHVSLTFGSYTQNFTNTITKAGLKTILDSVKGVSKVAKYIAFGTGVNVPTEDDTELTNPTFFPIRKFYFNENTHKLVFSYLVDSFSSIDNIEQTEIGVFDDSKSLLFSRALLLNPIKKEAGLQLSGTWEYLLKEGSNNKERFRIVVEPFRGAYINNNFEDGFYEKGTILKEPTWYNLQDRQIEHYYCLETEKVITFPLVVTQDMTIAPTFDEINQHYEKYHPYLTATIEATNKDTRTATGLEAHLFNLYDMGYSLLTHGALSGRATPFFTSYHPSGFQNIKFDRDFGGILYYPMFNKFIDNMFSNFFEMERVNEMGKEESSKLIIDV
jgi:hypothetical protein